ncbi:hypothetical protein SAMN05661093_02619 [Kibdelosporangium aridum]|uniref:Uncharacterized protein n=1 Tax=Kibdelosporangium aridum TaxID=2030 RepID=A0A1Y5XEW2_KIBAR|nr:hypothetical protein SAMN05661093_02619 [Kibdelosporangium aridum]
MSPFLVGPCGTAPLTTTAASQRGLGGLRAGCVVDFTDDRHTERPDISQARLAKIPGPFRAGKTGVGQTGTLG